MGVRLIYGTDARICTAQIAERGWTMRIIDADALHINIIGGRMNGKIEFANAVKAMINDAPTVDAVPVIRCKDCALWNDTDSEHLVGYCTEGDGEKITFRNEWCCWAERKEE